VTSLDFDPSVPGARELHAAPRQIKQGRLSTPAGDNAIESLLGALHAGAPAAQVAPLSDQVITAMGKPLNAALVAGHDDAARSAYRRAQKFTSDSGRLKGDAWKNLRKSLAAPLMARMDKAAESSDVTGMAQAKALATTLGLGQTELDPAWSRAVAAPKPGKVIRSSGPTVVLVQPPSAGRPGVAFMREEVTRADYAAFASSTNRPISRCRNRLAPITIKKRTWIAPGFDQTGAHPAVCVSFEDASAYARWLSLRTGETYRLPTAAEWHLIANYKSSGNACQDGRVDCGEDGTVPAGQGPVSPLGLTGVHGNAREWLSDCGSGCRQRLVSGVGWRDNANRAEPTRSSGFDAAVGFDDTGFRLVREVTPR
jgi:hypothetical protein